MASSLLTRPSVWTAATAVVGLGMATSSYNHESRAIHADSPSVGQFTCSNDLFNRTFTLIRWAQSSNMVSIMTDCPHREKLGWLEEDHLNGPALRYNFNMNVLFAKVMNSSPVLIAHAPLIARAIDISSRTRSGYYDCLYVALAERVAVGFA